VEDEKRKDSNDENEKVIPQVKAVIEVDSYPFNR